MKRFALLAAALAACSPAVDPTNPYDPATPPELQAKATVRGAVTASVLASPEGLPVLLRTGGRVVAQVSTGATGAFVFDRLVPGDYQVLTTATGFVPQSIAVSLAAGDDLDLGSLELVPLYGESAATLAGTVTLQGITGSHAGTLVEAIGKSYTALTDESGGFRMTVIPGDYTLRFSHADFKTRDSLPFTVGAGQEFRVADEQLPTNPATVRGYVHGELPDGSYGPLVDARVSLEGTSVNAFSVGPDGYFELQGIPSGSYVIRVVLAGYEAAALAVFNLVGGEVRDLADPIQIPLSRGGISGAVALADSSDASGTLVELVGTGHALVTGRDGSYAFTGLLVGPYEVAARRDGYAPQSRTGVLVAAGATTAAPAMTLSRQGGTVSIAEAPYTRNPAVTLQLNASGVSHYRASEDPAFAGASWGPFTVGFGEPFALSDVDGEHTVYVQFAQDVAGANPSAVVSTSVVLDRVAPVAPGLIVGADPAWPWVRDDVVGLTLSAQDLPAVAGQVVSGLDRMELVNGTDFSVGAQNLPFNTSQTWALAAGTVDGPKTVSARFVDRAGNVSAPVTRIVTLDTVNPSSPTISVSGPDASRPGETRTPIVTVAVSAFDANGGAANANLLVRLGSTSGFVGASYQPYQPTLSWLLSPGDGTKTVWAQFKDPAGNESAAVSATIDLDTSGPSAPTVAITEADARPTNGQTNVAGVTLRLSANDSPVEAIVAENPALTGGVLVDLRAVVLPHDVPFVLGGLGPRTIWVRYYDAAGNPSELATATVTLDQTAPTATAPTLSPSPWAPTTAITVTPPSAGQDEMQVSGAGISGVPAFVAAPAGVGVAATLTAGDGPKAITVTYRDLAENTATINGLSVTLDGSAPTAANFTIRGALADGTASTATTTTQSVTLDLSGQSDAGSGISLMMVSESATFAGASWQPFASAAPFTLSAGDATKTVYAKFRDAVGNTTAVAVTGAIALDTTGPTAPTVTLLETDARPSNGYTNNRAYRLTLNASGTPVRALVAESAGFAGATTISLVGQTLPYTTTAGALSLADADGPHTVWVRFFDAAGNGSDAVASSVTLDRAAPSNTAPTLSVSGFTGTTAITLTPPSAGQDELQLSGAGVSAAGAYLSPGWGSAPAGVPIALTLTAGDGPKAISVTYRDLADNSTVVTPALSVTLDGSAPTAANFTIRGALADGTASTATTTTQSVTLDLSGQSDAGSGISLMMVSESATFVGASWQPFASAAPFTLSAGDATKTVYAKFRDAVGNTTAVAVTGAIALDTTGPASPSMALVETDARPSNGYTSARAYRLTLNASGTPVRALVSESAGFAGAATVDLTGQTLPYTTTAGALNLADADGPHTIWVRFFDAAGNGSEVVAASVQLDRLGPASWAPTIAPSPYAPTTAIVVTPPSAGQDEMQLSGAGISGTPPFVAAPAGVGVAATLTAGDGAKAITVTYRDLAENTATINGLSVTLDGSAPVAANFTIRGALADGTASTTTTTTQSVTLDLSGQSDAGSGLSQMILSESATFVGASWQPFAAAAPFTLSAGDATKTVYAKLKDAVGNTTAVAVTGAIALDTTGPTSPSATLLETDARPSNGYTNARAYRLTLNASGTPVRALVSESPSFSGATTISLVGQTLPYTTTAGALSLADADGPHTVWVRFFDAAGNPSDPATATVTLDRSAPSNTAPTLSVSGFTGTTAITLTPPNAGQDELQISGAGVSAAGVHLSPGWGSAPTGVPINVTLTAGDGAKAISVTYRDLAENTTTVTPALSVTLDGAAPTASNFTITGTLADGTTSTTYAATTSVTLNLSAQTDGTGAGIQEMMLSNVNTFAGATWQTFSSSTAVPWSLSPGDAAKTVYAKFRDAMGNATAVAVTGTITLAATPPSGGTLVVAGGAAATSVNPAPLAVTANNATQMRVTVDGVAGSWIAYPPSPPATATLIDPDQVNKVIQVTFRNAARVEGAGVSASIRYDHTAPGIGGLTLSGTLGNGAISPSPTMTAAILAQLVPPSADTAEMALAQTTTLTDCSSVFGSPTWQPVARSATVVLTGGDGAKRICALFRDGAGNASALNAIGADITLDTAPPTNPSFADLSTTTTNQYTVSGTLVVASTDPAPNTGVSYQCYRSPASPTWTDCTPAGDVFTFVLTPNAPNVVGIRARDGAYNVSAGTTVQVIQDAVAPFPPNITAIRTTKDSLTLTWDPSADTDVDRFLVYYGNSAGDTAGTGAAQGPSPIPIRAAGTGAHTLTLTGLVAGMPYYVAVEAVDVAGNASGLSGQRVAVPNKVNPRLLSSIGGQMRSVATLTDATSGKTFAYLAQNQGVVQMDVTDEASVPKVVGRAFVPNFVPDPIADPGAGASLLPSRRGGPPAVITCSRSGVQGHCVVMAGSTLEGDYRGDPDGFRAPSPVIFFPLNGSNTNPALGTVETTLPVLPHWVLAGVVDGQQIVYTLEKDRIVAFSLDRIAFPRVLSEAPLPGGIGTFLAADINGTELYFYAAAIVPGYARLYPPVVWYVDLTDAPYGALYPQSLSSLYDNDGLELGDGYYGQYTPYPAFDNGIYVAFKDSADTLQLCSWDPWDEPWPKACAPLLTDPDVDIQGATAGNGHAYVFASQGLGPTPYAYQVALSGLSVTHGTDITSLRNESYGGTVATYATIPATTTEHLLAIDRDGNLDFNLERWRVNGAAITYNANRFREIQPERFAEQGRFVFAAQGSSIHVIDYSNPMVPRVVTTLSRANNNYKKLVAHGRWLYAIAENYTATGHGVEIFLISGSDAGVQGGKLTYQTRIATTQIPNDIAAMGRWLFVARSSATGLLAYDVGTPSAPVAAGSVVTTSFVYALDARAASSAGTPYTAIVYAAQSAASPATAALQTYAYSYSAVTPATSTLVALATPVTLPGNDTPTAVTVRGSYAAVSTPSSTSVYSVGSPASPSLNTAGLPISGPLAFQGGYLVGLGPSGAASGPLFEVFTGSAATSGPVDGSLLYSACADSGGAGSFAHVSGTYVASCQRNGIATFSVGSTDGGRLVKRYDISDSWMGDSAALAGDGVYSFFGGPLYQTLDPTRLYYESEQLDSTGGFSAPVWYTNATLPGTKPYPMWMLQQDGIIWGFNGEYLSNNQGVEAWESYLWNSRKAVTLGTIDLISAQPATDGEWGWIPRSSRFGGSWSSLEVHDLRNPAAYTGAATTTDSFVTFGNKFTALWWARDRLYVGWESSGAIKVYNATGATLNTISRTSIPSITTARTITGITTSGRYLFATYQKDDPALWGLTILKLDPVNLDGNGYSLVGSITSNLPLANPVVAGDVLYVSNNLGVGAVDLTPLWQSGTMPTFTSGTVNVDPIRTGPVRFYVDGPFGFLMGGGYRAFDLR